MTRPWDTQKVTHCCHSGYIKVGFGRGQQGDSFSSAAPAEVEKSCVFSLYSAVSFLSLSPPLIPQDPSFCLWFHRPAQTLESLRGKYSSLEALLSLSGGSAVRTASNPTSPATVLLLMWTCRRTLREDSFALRSCDSYPHPKNKQANKQTNMSSTDLLMLMQLLTMMAGRAQQQTAGRGQQDASSAALSPPYVPSRPSLRSPKRRGLGNSSFRTSEAANHIHLQRRPRPAYTWTSPCVTYTSIALI